MAIISRAKRAALILLDRVPDKNKEFLKQVDPADRAIIEQAKRFSLVPIQGLYSLILGVEYLVRRGIPGAFVECGVARGGAVLAMLLKLRQLGVTDREIWLYDTFEGTVRPTEVDTSVYERPALETWEEGQRTGVMRWWGGLIEESKATIWDEHKVAQVLQTSGYPMDRIRFVKGPVEKTVPAQIPELVALLRLDTDWYESTLHELQHFYPRLSDSGILIVDDYGAWEGCRRAVDEYFSSEGRKRLLFSPIGFSGRLAVKA